MERMTWRGSRRAQEKCWETRSRSTTKRLKPRPTWLASVAVLFVLTGIAGCGTHTATRYKDKVYGFSFKMPSGWQAPKAGKRGMTSDGIQGYTVQFINPPGFHVVVDSSRPDFSKVPNGKLVVNNAQAGCPTFCAYFKIKVSHRPALLIRKLDSKKRVYEELVFVNSQKWGYDIALASATPIPRPLDKQFGQVVATFKIGPNG